jgi:hypothetical protein
MTTWADLSHARTNRALDGGLIGFVSRSSRAKLARVTLGSIPLDIPVGDTKIIKSEQTYDPPAKGRSAPSSNAGLKVKFTVEL